MISEGKYFIQDFLNQVNPDWAEIARLSRRDLWTVVKDYSEANGLSLQFLVSPMSDPLPAYKDRPLQSNEVEITLPLTMNADAAVQRVNQQWLTVAYDWNANKFIFRVEQAQPIAGTPLARVTFQVERVRHAEFFPRMEDELRKMAFSQGISYYCPMEIRFGSDLLGKATEQKSQMLSGIKMPGMPADLVVQNEGVLSWFEQEILAVKIGEIYAREVIVTKAQGKPGVTVAPRSTISNESTVSESTSNLVIFACAALILLKLFWPNGKKG